MKNKPSLIKNRAEILYSLSRLLICVLSIIIIPVYFTQSTNAKVLGKGLVKDMKNIRFQEKMWDGQILRILIEGPNYLAANLEFDVSAPPRNDSVEVKEELQLLDQYATNNRNQSVIKEIKREAEKMAFVDMFLNPKDLPAKQKISKELAKAAYHILVMADKECRYFVVKYKKRFARPRPSQLSPDLKLVVPNPGHAAFPSGHATQSMLSALILSAIDPLNKTTYIQYANDMARRREIAGVHYPSDSAAGQKLANGILAALMKLPVFKQDLTKVVLDFSRLKNH